MRKHWPNREGWERGDRFNGAGAGGYFMGGASTSCIQSIQAATITIANGSSSNTGTITTVVTANSEIVLTGIRGTDTGTMNRFQGRVALTNSTTVTATRASDADSMTGALIISFVVVEYKAGFVKSAQRGTVTLSSVSSNTATITSVVTANSKVIDDGSSCDQPSGSNNQDTVALTSATIVTVTRGAATSDLIASYQVTEFNP